ncbi:phosphoesterase PA-phosphatase [Actinoplanes derwentensis]|uniref:PAP2 superfamily protein n=1 Tax=Actinoplanes derwentensis TaxID=113562 RepID=A0A1H2CVR0_9ACTN|nr:phosphoesterase PA-phosphatase [Actinoplanes derwentensis]GID82077.1 hypothetical protein Ade03nite_10010 [Actinoplanes derwentensis]SDT74563.1 hypothetical protein SAMN04489716_7020 [Actinoplanes derwentensis]
MPVRNAPVPIIRLRRRVAKLITNLLSPAVLVAGILLSTAWHTAPSTQKAALWGLIAAAAASFLPITYIIRGVKRGQWSNHHVPERDRRSLPLLVCVGSTTAGTVLLAWADAPRQLLALIACMVAALAIATPITLALKWKISIHALVAAGVAVATVVLFHPVWLLPTAVIAAAVMWSRVEIRDHTVGQVIAGAVVGMFATGVLLPLWS